MDEYMARGNTMHDGDGVYKSLFFFFSSRRRHTRCLSDWNSDVCSSDLAAEREGVTPKELADRNAARFEALGPRINVSNDFFIRTSDPRHKRRVQDVMQRVYDNGYAYKGMYEGWYCPRCADFKTEAEIGPENTC